MRTIYTFVLLLLANTTIQAQWVLTSGPTEAYVTALAANDNVIIAGCSSIGSNQGGHYSLDDGDNWTSTGFSLVSKFKSLAINPSTGTIYAGGQNCFYQSFDNGVSFTNTNTGLTAYDTYDIIVEGTDLYASNSGIYKSTNGGFNWTMLTNSMNATKIDKSGNIFIAATASTGVHLSLNNGSTWSNATTGLPTNITDVLISGSNLLASTVSGIYISTNNGSNWALTNLTTSTWCMYKIGTTLFAGCDNGSIYYCNDGGNTWIASSAGLANFAVYSFTSNSNYIFAGTTSHVYRRPLIEFGNITKIENQNTSLNFDLIPNPNSGQVVISMNNNSTIEIEITNTLGQIIYQTKSRENKISIDLNNERAGVYFVKVSDGVIAKKITKMIIN